MRTKPRRRDFLRVLLGMWEPDEDVRDDDYAMSPETERVLRESWDDPVLMSQFYED
jgi:hypothetical protein